MSYAAKPAPVQDQAGEGTNTLAMASLVLGILGFVTGGCPFSLAAVVTGWMGMKREPQGMAKIGFWLGVAGMILQVLLGLFLLLSFGAAFGLAYTTVETRTASPAPPVVISGEPAPVAIEAAAPTVPNDVEPTPPVDPSTDPTVEGSAVAPRAEEVPDPAP